MTHVRQCLAWTVVVVMCACARTPARQASIAPVTCGPTVLKQEIDSLNAEMIRAGGADPASVADFYRADATILSGQGTFRGSEAIRRYWASGPAWREWRLEVLEAGGGCGAPWAHGSSTITSGPGASFTAEFVAVFRRDDLGRLRYYLDMYVPRRP